VEAIVSEQSTSSTTVVRHFRQILLWPLQLMPIRPGSQIQEHWELLDQEIAAVRRVAQETCDRRVVVASGRCAKVFVDPPRSAMH